MNNFVVGMRGKILIVEDEPDILRTLTMSLEMEGFHVHTAANGKDAIAVARRVCPRVVILDVMIPDINGYEVTRCLKHDPTLNNLKIIILTAFAQKDEKERAELAGADCYMTKPFEMERLHESVKQLLLSPDVNRQLKQ